MKKTTDAPRADDLRGGAPSAVESPLDAPVARAPDAGGKRPGPLDRYLSAFTLASRLPVGIRFRYDQSRLDWHLPLVGVPVAASAAAALFLARALGCSPFFASLCAIAFQYFCFNLFHLDGLMDSADALLGGGDREKRLAILKDPRIGVYAFFAGALDLAFKAALLARLCALPAGIGALSFAVLAAYPVSGRAAAALVPAFARPARQDGLGVQAEGGRAYRAFGGTALAILPFLAIGISVDLMRGVGLGPWNLGLWFIVPAAALFTAGFMARSYRKAVGGYTGDAQGAAVELAELVHLVLGLLMIGSAP
jgi:adenosylcobinamide-GDP ribazoletransferase